MILSEAYFSEVGPRTENQDRVLSPQESDDSTWIAAIADGVGGAPGGAIAAELAISEVASGGTNGTQISQIFSQAKAQLDNRARADVHLKRMATTLSVAYIRGQTVTIGHVGDTRIYHLRGAGLRNLTEDQTEVAELVRRGTLSERQADRYRRKHVLTSALSAAHEYSLFTSQAELASGDRLLFLTDGVYSTLKRGAILNLSLANESVNGFIAELRNRIAEAGPNDNYSALAVQLGPPSTSRM